MSTLPARSSAAKVRRYRARQALGLCVLRLEAEEHRLAAYLIETGRLAPDQTLSRAHLERATAEVLAELLARWSPK